MKMTCCECEFPFDYYEGDYDERMCFRCLYEENTEQSYKSGVFGSPTFIYNGEVFWGDDRLEDCIKWINIK